MRLLAAINAQAHAEEALYVAIEDLRQAIKPVMKALSLDRVYVTRFKKFSEILVIDYEYSGQGGDQKASSITIPMWVFEAPLPQVAVLDWREQCARREAEQTLARKRQDFERLKKELGEA